MPGILEVVRREDWDDRDEYLTILAFADGKFELRVPFPNTGSLGPVVGCCTIKTATSSIQFTPCVDGFSDGCSTYQRGAIYEVVPPTYVYMGGFTWSFVVYHGPLPFHVLPNSPVLPSEDDRSVVMTTCTKQSSTTSTGAVLARDLLPTQRKFPLWLPGPRDFAGPNAQRDIQRFFSAGRIRSSLEAETAVTFPYGRGVDFFATLRGLPASVYHLHLVNLAPTDSMWLGTALTAASLAPSITKVSVEYGVDFEHAGAPPKTDDSRGNLVSFSWPNLTHIRCLDWVSHTLSMNPGIRELAIGGMPNYIWNVLRGSRRRNLTALHLNLVDCIGIEGILDLLQINDFNLQEISLELFRMPDPDVLLKFFSRFASTLVKVHVAVIHPHPHFDCNDSCGKRMFPHSMPALRSVSLKNLPCSKCCIPQPIELNTVQQLSLATTYRDHTHLRDYFGRGGRHLPPANITELCVSPGCLASALMIRENMWDLLRVLSVGNLQLSDIPTALKLGRHASKIVLVVGVPTQQSPHVPRHVSHVCENAIADHYFVDNFDGISSLSDCRDLQDLKIVFGTRRYDGWDRPTLGSCFYQGALRHLSRLRRFETNEISHSLLSALEAHRRNNEHFSFYATVYSGNVDLLELPHM